jgi:signal recognition particle subunit SRP54
VVSLFGSLGERVRQGLRRTRELMDEGLGAILSIARPVDEAMLEELEETLIAADLGAAAAGAFVKRVRDEVKRGRVASSQDVRASLHRFLEESLAGAAAPLRLDAHPTVILMLGVNGAGKTTSTAKLAAALKADGKRVLMAAADTFRAAAIEQLQEWGRRIGVEVIHQAAGADPAAVVFDAMKAASSRDVDVLLVDTAGRLHIDEQLMTELQQLREMLTPVEILFVADAMTGQDAVKSADEFHKRLSITGIVLTKMDGDARGGAALSIRQVTGEPLKFIGVGEKFDAFEVFHPDRVASRILGMGDVLSFIEKAEEAIDKKQAVEMQRKLIENDFTLEDFRDQLRQVRKLGPLESILGMMPNVGLLKDLKNVKVDEKEITHIVAIIDSMTPRERANHMIINGSRRRRIAKGSGTTVQEVNQLLKQYTQARKMMKSFSGGFLGKKLGKMKLPAF